jgi:uncharacterized Zn-finger protein
MRKYVVFATLAGDVFACSANQFWKHVQNQRGILDVMVKMVSVTCETKQEALSHPKSYGVVCAARRSGLLNRRGC